MGRLRTITALLMPPLAVYLQERARPHFWLNLVLTLLCFLPGVVHAWWLTRRAE